MASLSTCHLGLWLGWQILLNLVKSCTLHYVTNPIHHTQSCQFVLRNVGSGGLMVRPPACRLRGQWFDSTSACRFEAWAISFTPLCPCLSEETLKAVGKFLHNKPNNKNYKSMLACQLPKTPASGLFGVEPFET